MKAGFCIPEIEDSIMTLMILVLAILSASVSASPSQSGICSIEGRIEAPLNAYIPGDAVVVLMDPTETIMAR